MLRQGRVSDMALQQPKQFFPTIQLLGKFYYIAGLLEVLKATYSNAYSRTRAGQYSLVIGKLSRLFLVTLNQSCRDDSFQLAQTLKEGEDPVLGLKDKSLALFE